jgi:hypothetical protein
MILLSPASGSVGGGAENTLISRTKVHFAEKVKVQKRAKDPERKM